MTHRNRMMDGGEGRQNPEVDRFLDELLREERIEPSHREEIRADLGAVFRLIQTRHNPWALSDVLERVERRYGTTRLEEMFSGTRGSERHPSTEVRLAAMKAFILYQMGRRDLTDHTSGYQAFPPGMRLLRARSNIYTLPFRSLGSKWFRKAFFRGTVALMGLGALHTLGLTNPEIYRQIGTEVGPWIGTRMQEVGHALGWVLGGMKYAGSTVGSWMPSPPALPGWAIKGIIGVVGPLVLYKWVKHLAVGGLATQSIGAFRLHDGGMHEIRGQFRSLLNVSQTQSLSEIAFQKALISAIANALGNSSVIREGYTNSVSGNARVRKELFQILLTTLAVVRKNFPLFSKEDQATNRSSLLSALGFVPPREFQDPRFVEHARFLVEGEAYRPEGITSHDRERLILAREFPQAMKEATPEEALRLAERLYYRGLHRMGYELFMKYRRDILEWYRQNRGGLEFGERLFHVLKQMRTHGRQDRSGVSTKQDIAELDKWIAKMVYHHRNRPWGERLAIAALSLALPEFGRNGLISSMVPQSIRGRFSPRYQQNRRYWREFQKRLERETHSIRQLAEFLQRELANRGVPPLRFT